MTDCCHDVPFPPHALRHYRRGTPPVTFARQALWGGATILQLRNKTASGRDLCRWSEAILPLTRQHNALFIVNDRLDIALATGADGVHLGQDDLPATVARKLLGPDRIIGVSTGTREEALQAEKEGADYVGFGHIFPTGSKDKPLPPVGTLALQDTASLLSIPLLPLAVYSWRMPEGSYHAELQALPSFPQ